MVKHKNMNTKLKTFRFLIISAVFLFICAVFILFTFQMEDTVYATGRVEGLREYDLRSMVMSHILKIRKDDGDFVARDEVIIMLDDRDLRDKIRMLNNEIGETQAELAVKLAELEVLRRNPLPKEYRYTEIGIDECRKKFIKSKEKLQMYKTLREKKVVSKNELDSVEAEHYTNTANLLRAEEDFRKVKSGLAAKIIGKAENEKKLLQVRLTNKKKNLSILKEKLREYTIRAPEDGIITELPYLEGKFLAQGEVAVKMSSTGKKMVAYVDEREIRKVTKGQDARMISNQYNYLDFGYFTGKVMDVDELPLEKNGVKFYPVEILITQEPYSLKLGSSADIMINTGNERIISALLGFRN